jgi:hypothetical protein
MAPGGAALLPARHRWRLPRHRARPTLPFIRFVHPIPFFLPTEGARGGAVLPPSRNEALAPPSALADDAGFGGACSSRSQANPFLCRRLLGYSATTDGLSRATTLNLRGFLWYTMRFVRPVEKRLVCNRKGLICKDMTVKINSIRLVFLAVVR